jgi:MFS family permease
MVGRTRTRAATDEIDRAAPAAVKPTGRRGRRAVAQTFRALRTPNYRLFWCGQVVSMIGTWMQRVAQAWLVLQLTGSPLALGIATACQTAPVLLFSLIGGVVADRVPKHRLLIATQTVMLIQASLFAVLTAGGWIRLIDIYLLAALWGIANAFDYPARQAFTKELVPAEDLPNAVALNSIVMNTARLGGPALSGLTIAAFGVTACFALNAVSFLAVIGALLLMRPDRFFDVPTPLAGRMLAHIAEGMRYVRRTPEIAVLLLLAVTLAVLWRYVDCVSLLTDVPTLLARITEVATSIGCVVCLARMPATTVPAASHPSPCCTDYCYTPSAY